MNNRHTLLLSLVLAGVAGAQDLPTNDALRNAIARSELEHDDAAARDGLSAIAGDDSVDPAVRRHAWLQLGKLSRRLGDERAARALLERAADGTDAVARVAGELLDQDPQDPERAKQLRERAEVALERYLSENGSLNDVVWFGDTAAALLVREYERLLAPSANDPYRQRTSRVVQALWTLDSDIARAFLAGQLGADEPDRRRFAVTAMGGHWEIPDADLPLLRTALADPDDSIVRAALRQWAKLGVGDLAPKIADPRVTVRLAALDSLQSWASSRFRNQEGRNAPDRRGEAAEIARHLPVPLAATDPAEFRYAADLLCTTGACSPAGRALLARSLAKLGDAASSVPFPRDPGPLGVNENADALGAAFEALGAVAPRNATAAQGAASTLLFAYLHWDAWDRDALGAMLTGARLGYGSPPPTWLDRYARPEDAPRIVEATADAPDFDFVAGWLIGRDLPESCFEPLRRIAEQRMQRGADDNVTTQVLVALGRTGHPDAAPYLRDVAGRTDGRAREAALGALSFAGYRRNDETTRDAIRAALLAVEPQGEDDLELAAARLFGQLVRMGDVEVFADPDGVQRRVARQTVKLSTMPGMGEAWEGYRVGPVLGDWLAVKKVSDGAPDWWNGYTDADRAQIWRQLLAKRADGGWRRDWEAVDRLLTFDPNRDVISDALVIVLCDAFTARCKGNELDDDLIRRALSKLVAPESRALFADSADVVASLDALRASLWSSPSAAARRIVALAAELPLDEDQRAHLVALLGDSQPQVSGTAWEILHSRAGVPIDAEQIARGLSSPNPDVRHQALDHASTAPAGLGDAVVPALADPDDTIRALACSVLGATLRLDVVPDLLAMLKDSSPAVRDSARDALQSIRFYHDEKAHWDRVFAGKAGLTAASAAEALLDQAKPGNDPQTRILAIRSLGVLAAPETLPFLITWTKDQDATVAAAAREAITTIHTREK